MSSACLPYPIEVTDMPIASDGPVASVHVELARDDGTTDCAGFARAQVLLP